MSKLSYPNTIVRSMGRSLDHWLDIGWRTVLCTLLAFNLGYAGSLMAQPTSGPSTVPQEYRRYFVHYQDNRSFLEKAYNLIGLSDLEVGRSFALIAGVDTYPNLPASDRYLKPAQVDIEKLVGYLRDYEFFDEVVVLRNEAVTDANFKYFLQTYFLDRLQSFPRSRFLFAYSGHGIQRGPRGYLLQSRARSFGDLGNSISLEVLTAYYRPVTEQAYYSLALINACHSGSFGSVAFGRENDRRLLPSDPGSHVITAGTTDQLAWHLGSVGEGSLFFEKILAGLGGWADDQPIQRGGERGDGVVTATELFDFLSQEIQLETNQRQQPQLIFFARDKLGSFFFLNRQRQVRANNAPAWESWRTSFGFDPPHSPQSVTLTPQTAETSHPLSDSPLRDNVNLDEDNLVSLAAEAARDKDFVSSTTLYSKGCEIGNLRACAELGNAYRRGIGNLPIDLKKASSLFESACDGGELLGCAYLGIAKGYDGVALLQRSCAGGELRGCTYLGTAYLYGKNGLAKDEKKAIELYRKACDGNELTGYSSLGFAYLYGKGGLSRDEQLAVSLFQKACSGGEMTGCFNLGWAYENALGGVPKDEGQAIEFYRMSCDGGEMNGCNSLGIAHEKGQGGLAKDYRLALDLYQKACNMGHSSSCTSYDLLEQKNLKSPT